MRAVGFGRALLTLRSASPICGRVTLEEHLALAREIAARTKPQFVSDNSRREVKMVRFEKVKARSKKLSKRKPK